MTNNINTMTNVGDQANIRVNGNITTYYIMFTFKVSKSSQGRK